MSIELEDDLIEVIKRLARRQDSTLSKVVSGLVRSALVRTPTATRNGVPLFRPVRSATAPNLKLVNRLRDAP